MNDFELSNAFEKRAVAGDGQFAIAVAIMKAASAQNDIAAAIRKLGTGDASTHMGAIELLSIDLKRIADAMQRDT